ncbi:uncharacterized protein LOC119726174 [Patiria miniata]|uniref:Uncharacterized protein n=1 Tax=Patiria miniata TaxID=46514 RepID=A0A913ZQQ9_PATMI|nr:uncharacterized protein LOC119726174 [Patiria miniata]
MEGFTKCCLLVVLAVCFGSLCVMGGDDLIGQGYNDGLYTGDFTDEEEGAEAFQNLIGDLMNDVGAENSLRDAMLEDTLAHAQFGAETKRTNRCRPGRCVFRGPNPNAGSRVLPFGKREETPANTLSRRGRGPSKNRPRGNRTLLPFGKRR